MRVKIILDVRNSYGYNPPMKNIPAKFKKRDTLIAVLYTSNKRAFNFTASLLIRATQALDGLAAVVTPLKSDFDRKLAKDMKVEINEVVISHSESPRERSKTAASHRKSGMIDLVVVKAS